MQDLDCYGACLDLQPVQLNFSRGRLNKALGLPLTFRATKTKKSQFLTCLPTRDTAVNARSRSYTVSSLLALLQSIILLSSS
jgi:hypothetical protein